MALLKSKFVMYPLVAVGLGVAVLGYMRVKHQLAEPAGASCEPSTSCRGNSMWSHGMCLEDEGGAYCTHDCSSDGDCGGGLACTAVEGTWTTETTRGNHATQVSTSRGTKNVCVKSR